MLAGINRLKLLRLILDQSGQNVSQLAKQLKIGVPDASQELRRLQSRGLIRRTCQGKSVVFLPIPDPQVASAAPLLETLKRILTERETDLKPLALLAMALGHERRIIMARAMLNGPRDRQTLAALIQSSLENTQWHLKTMLQGGLVVRQQRKFVVNPVRSPLMATLLELLCPDRKA